MNKVIDRIVFQNERAAKKIRFLFIGASTFLVYILLLYLFNDLIKAHHNLSLSMAYLLSVAFHFMANKFFVFKEKRIKTVQIQLPKYVVLVITNCLITLAVVNVLLCFYVNIYFSAAIATLTTTLITYLAMSRLIFVGR